MDIDKLHEHRFVQDDEELVYEILDHEAKLWDAGWHNRVVYRLLGNKEVLIRTQENFCRWFKPAEKIHIGVEWSCYAGGDCPHPETCLAYGCSRVKDPQ